MASCSALQDVVVHLVPRKEMTLRVILARDSNGSVAWSTRRNMILVNSSLGQYLMEKMSQHSSDPAWVALGKSEKYSYA